MAWSIVNSSWWGSLSKRVLKKRRRSDVDSSEWGMEVRILCEILAPKTLSRGVVQLIFGTDGWDQKLREKGTAQIWWTDLYLISHVFPLSRMTTVSHRMISCGHHYASPSSRCGAFFFFFHTNSDVSNMIVSRKFVPIEDSELNLECYFVLTHIEEKCS